MTGYRAISDVYQPGTVKNVRDSEVPVCFVESTHSIGEWMGIHKLTDIKDCLWNYHYDNELYLCRQQKVAESTEESQPPTNDIESFLSTL
jgi:CRISPR-associated protein Csy2